MFFPQIVRKMILWCKKKIITHSNGFVLHIWFPTLFPRAILIFQGVLTKFNFLTKFQHLKKYYIDLMKDLKYEHQSTFALWGRVKLNFRDKYGKNSFANNSSRNQFFSSNSQKLSLWCKKKSLPTQMHLYSPYMFHYTLP